MTLLIDDFPDHPCGLGATFAYVLFQMLRLRDRDFRVRITKQNNPYRDWHGPNPWDYYFSQRPAAGPFTQAPLEHPIDLAFSGHRNWTLARQRAVHAFAVQHIQLLPHIQAEVDSFCAQHLSGKTLAIHIRGTDKRTEYREMNGGELVAQVKALIARLRPDSLFLMTDDVEYHALLQPLGFMSQTMPRSKRSLHHNPPVSPYHSGLSVIMDSFIAARAKWFFYTPSNTAVTPLAMGDYEEIGRLNQYCQILPFSERVDRALGLL